MYFINEAHEQNYELLMKHFYLQERQYEENVHEDDALEANIYVAAVPDIFKAITLSNLSPAFPPCIQLLDEPEYHEKERLTEESYELVQLANNLYQSLRKRKEINLAPFFATIQGQQLLDVIFQMINIHLNRK